MPLRTKRKHKKTVFLANQDYHMKRPEKRCSLNHDGNGNEKKNATVQSKRFS